MVSIDKARDFVYQHGALWERALFSYLFDDGSLERLHQCLLCYKNEDGGFAHGLEHDIKCPDSNPLQLEFLLSIHRDTGIPMGNLLDGAVEWVENNRNEDGSLKNPDTLHKYPHAPWWSHGGQTAPDAITGHLIKLGLSTPSLEASTAKWVEENLTLEKIKSNEWLFMAYHAHDYFLNIASTPETESFRQATIDNIIECAQKVGEKQYFTFFQFATSPDSELVEAAPPGLVDKFLDYLATSQREDGGWSDEHGLVYWQPYFSTVVLLTLKRFNRI